MRDSLPKTMIGKLSKKELVAEEAAKAPGVTGTLHREPHLLSASRT